MGWHFLNCYFHEFLEIVFVYINFFIATSQLGLWIVQNRSEIGKENISPDDFCSNVVSNSQLNPNMWKKIMLTTFINIYKYIIYQSNYWSINFVIF